MNYKVKAMQEEFNRNIDSIIESIKETSKSKEDFLENLQKAFPGAIIEDFNALGHKDDCKDVCNCLTCGLSRVTNEFVESISPDKKDYKVSRDEIKSCFGDDTMKLLGFYSTIQGIIDSNVNEISRKLSEMHVALVTRKVIQDIFSQNMPNAKTAEKAESPTE